MDDESTVDQVDALGETVVLSDDIDTIDEELGGDDLSDGVPVAEEERPFDAIGPDAPTGRFRAPRLARAS